jgi:23S rRNA (cytosine1962-C5)-methyltransferase
MTPVLYLKPNREKSVLQHHPWLFSGAIERIDGSPSSGETVIISDSKSQKLGWAAFSPISQIRARMWTFNPDEIVDVRFLRERLNRAILLREKIISDPQTSAYRLVYAESDGIPGFIVDRYNDTLVVQILSTGPEFWKDTLVSLLSELTGVKRIFERSDVDVRRLEGLPDRMGPICGTFDSEKELILENGLSFWVDLAKGHKTGFYLDQRANRNLLKQYAKNRSVLNCFSYTGGFTVNALAGGAESVTSVDSSAEVLALGAKNVALNSLPTDQTEWLEGDVFMVLRKFRDQGHSFDLIILDPPKFAPTASQVEHAARGYKDINLLAFKLLRAGGILFTFSCSGGITSDLFQKIVAGAALDAKVEAKILATMTQAGDHPVALSFPEGAYLKGLICSI